LVYKLYGLTGEEIKIVEEEKIQRRLKKLKKLEILEHLMIFNGRIAAKSSNSITSFMVGIILVKQLYQEFLDV